MNELWMKRCVAAAMCLSAALAVAQAVTAADPDERFDPPIVAMSPVKAIQGYATDGVTHYMSSTSEIAAFDKDWKPMWNNKAPFGTMFDPSVDHKHVGDIDAYDGKIYAPVETYHSCTDNTLQKIAIFDAKDGSFISFTDVSPYKHEISSIAVQPSTQSMYVTSFCESWEIPHYDLKTMQPMAPLKLDHAIPKMQGISWSEQRKMFVVTSDSPAQKVGYVWGVTPEGHVSLLFTAPQTGEMEGVDYTTGQIRYLLKHVWFLDPAIGSKTEAAAAGWDWTVATTGELTEAGAKNLEKLSYDFAQLERYRHENEQLPALKKGEKRVVFYGDSITDNWGHKVGEFFPGKGYINRGISGQTTAQMLLRFRQDVIDLHPAVVVLLAGTNDIAGNFGPSSPKMAADNIASMADLAKANGIKMVICSVLPADHYRWRTDVHPAAYIKQMNVWLKDYATKNHLVYVDYYAAMANANGGLDEKLAKDGVHPTVEGYAIMAPLADAGIAKAMK